MVYEDEEDPSIILRNLKLHNSKRIVIAHINVNGLAKKIESLKFMIKNSIDILVITESKLDSSFPANQFLIDGFSKPFRLDKSSKSAGVLIYVRDDIPSRKLKCHISSEQNRGSFEGIFVEINLRKQKWLLFGGYSSHKRDISHFLRILGSQIDYYLGSYDNIILLGDFNSQPQEYEMKEFCDTYNLNNLVNEPTCFKNILNPSKIDLILTNKPRSFQGNTVLETGISDHHKMTVTVLKTHFEKQAPIKKNYRNYKLINMDIFKNDFKVKLDKQDKTDMTYETYETIFMEQLNIHAPLKTKNIRANNAPFMNKFLSKAVMTRSRLKNKYLKDPSLTNKINYKKYRNYCVNLFKREKKKYYNNLHPNQITDNKKFWNTVKPLFSDKQKTCRNITLIENDEVISNDIKVANIMNSFFSNAVNNLGIQGYHTENTASQNCNDLLQNIIDKFDNHPSIVKIKEKVQFTDKFSFKLTNVKEIFDEINALNTNKPTTFNNIPAKLLVQTNDITSPYLTDIYNNSKKNAYFPNELKNADITPVHKKDETVLKENYRPVSILPCVSKIFERNMYTQINEYMNNHLSSYLCGFRKDYSTQYCLAIMLNRWHKALDKNQNAGALLTDLSKAFDCINHDLLIAKLEAYGFDHNSLMYINSYLTGRKQRTKVNNSFSTWADIITGVPQGSILGPLLFNIYINDIFYFITEINVANYADDNTPYAINESIENIINILESNSSTLIKWFNDNYLKMNTDKCHLLITNHDDDVTAKIGNDIIHGSKFVKLLGVKIDNKLDFNVHISNLCKKVSLKLHALARISHFMEKNKLRIIMKAFIESQFGYCPLIWMFHSRSLNNRINHLHERALRLVYKNYTASFEELLSKDNSFTVHHKNLQKLAIEMFKVKNNILPNLSDIFSSSVNNYNFRYPSSFKTENIRTVYNGTETIYYRGPKTWELVPEVIRMSDTLTEFKTKIKKWLPKGCECRLCKLYIPELGFI